MANMPAGAKGIYTAEVYTRINSRALTELITISNSKYYEPVIERGKSRVYASRDK